jgi:uncharacterized damage-inducible protein DinB
MVDSIHRPQDDRVPSYYRPYVARPDDDDALVTLRAQSIVTRELLRSLPEERGSYRYAEGKWSVKELVSHLIDTDRIFGYRALCFARGCEDSLPGDDDDACVASSGAGERSLAELIEELESVRSASLTLFTGMTVAQLDRVGTANGVEMDARTVAWVIAGHEAHHRDVLRERYL